MIAGMDNALPLFLFVLFALNSVSSLMRHYVCLTTKQDSVLGVSCTKQAADSAMSRMCDPNVYKWIVPAI